MKVLIVPDSFKESLDAKEVAEAIHAGICSVCSSLKIEQIPFSDGGEGALDVLHNFAQGDIVSCKSMDAIGNSINASYFLFKNKKTAWIELSQSSGIALLSKEKRKPCYTSTYGTGLVIKEAISRGCEEIILGIGGSATNDAAAGIFQALGGQLLDSDGVEIQRGGLALNRLNQIILPKGLDHISWRIACDVENPLVGTTGASTVYGPQKGASKADVMALENSLNHFSDLVEQQLKKNIKKLKGGGAAGGTSAGMYAFFDAELVRGFDLLSGLIGLEEKISDVDLIFTAEGSIDSQSLNGKVPIGVARLGRKHNVPVIGLAGNIEPPFDLLYKEGMSGVFSIQSGPITLEKSKEMAFELVAQTAARVFTFYQNINH